MQQDNCDGPDKWRQREICTCSGGSQMTQSQDEKHEADADA
jgi:hypothetical protein